MKYQQKCRKISCYSEMSLLTLPTNTSNLRNVPTTYLLQSSHRVPKVSILRSKKYYPSKGWQGCQSRGCAHITDFRDFNWHANILYRSIHYPWAMRAPIITPSSSSLTLRLPPLSHLEALHHDLWRRLTGPRCDEILLALPPSLS